MKEGRIEVKVGGFTVLDMNVWMLWYQHLMQSGMGLARGPLIQIFIDGEEVPEPEGGGDD